MAFIKKFAGKWLTFVVTTMVLAVSSGCAGTTERDPCDPSDLSGCVIEEVEIQGDPRVDEEEVGERIATAESDHVFGGALEGVPVLGLLDTLSVEYERFDRFVLQRDLARVARFYRRKGFYEAIVRAGRVTRLEEDRVRVEVVVDAGQPVTLRTVSLEWKDWRLPDAEVVTAEVTEEKSELPVGAVFDEDAYDDVKKAMLKVLTDGGFAYAGIEGRVSVDLPARAADVVFDIELGPVCRFGDITIEGEGELPVERIRQALGFEKGEQFSTASLESAESALADFGVFASTELIPERSPDGEPRDPDIPVLVRLQPDKLRAIKAGLGAELGDRLEAHTVVGWEDKNIFRLLDRYSIEARPGVVFYPIKVSTLADERDFVEPLPHLRVRTQYRLPIPYTPRTVFTQAAEYNFGRPRNADTPDDPDEDQPILGYHEFVGRLGLERRFFNSVFTAAPSYNILFEIPFSYNDVDLAPGFESLTIPFIDLFLELDLRRNADDKLDRVRPNKGGYFATDVQFAGRFLGGDADDVRLRPEVRGYAPISRKVTLGVRVVTGLLFASNYGEVLDNTDSIDDLRPDGNDARRSQLNFDRQILEFRGFFSGGPNSNRGYSFGEIGPHAVLDFDGFRLDEPDAVGGRTLWEASLELRVVLGEKWAGVGFVDASDVTRQLAQYRLDHPHVATGAGLRYQTPVGPLRLDIGYRIPYLQVIGEEEVVSCLAKDAVCSDLVIDEGDPGNIFGIPIAVAIAVGEAF